MCHNFLNQTKLHVTHILIVSQQNGRLDADNCQSGKYANPQSASISREKAAYFHIFREKKSDVLARNEGSRSRPKVLFQSDYSLPWARLFASRHDALRPRYDRGDKSWTVKHRRKLCEVSSRHQLNVCLLRTYDSSSAPSRYIRLSRRKMIIIVSRRCTFAACYVFSRFGLSRGNTKLLGHVSHLIIPACRRGACATLIHEKYDPTCFGRREDRSALLLYLGDKSKFPASPLCS